VFDFVVFVQADIQWIALVVDTVTEVLARVRAVAVLARVRALDLRIAGPNVENKYIYDNDGKYRRESTREKHEWELAGLCDAMVSIGAAERQDRRQPPIIPHQQEQ